MNSRFKQILELLSTRQFITSAQIASIIQVSQKTARTYLKQLDEELQKHGARLLAKPREGFRLQIIEEKVYSQWFSLNQEDEMAVPTTSSERVDYILTYLFDHTDYIKLDDLCQLVCVSRNTVTSELKRVESILARYQLTISRRPNYGIRLEGKEQDKRRYIAEHLGKKNIRFAGTPKQRVETQLMADILKEVLQAFHIKLSVGAYNSMVIHICVSNKRIRQEFNVVYSCDVRREILENIQGEFVAATQELTGKIREKIGVTYSDDEITYLSLLLNSKANFIVPEKELSDEAVSRRIDELVSLMLEAVYEGNKLDFRDNLELRVSLRQHLVPLDIRVRYNIPLKNPILDQVKREYAVAYTVAATACAALGKYYHKELTEDETGYIAVLFALAMEKSGKTPRRYNIIIVSASGRGNFELFLYKFKQTFSKYINKIYECSFRELDNLDFKALDIDYVFTTHFVNMKLPVPIFEISLFMDPAEINKYINLFEKADDGILSHYFDPALFLSGLEITDKQEIIRIMCEHTAKHHSIPEDFFSLVMQREEMGQTDFGNLVAIPHPCRVVGSEKFVTAAVLEKPIWWGHNDVQIVFLISLSEKRDEDIEHFYKIITNFFSNPDLVQKVIQNPEFPVLMEQLQEAGTR